MKIHMKNMLQKIMSEMQITENQYNKHYYRDTSAWDFNETYWPGILIREIV